MKWLKIKKLRYRKGDVKVNYNYDISDTFSVINVTNNLEKYMTWWNLKTTSIVMERETKGKISE